MARPRETFSKKEAEKRKMQKRKEKEERKEARKANAKEGASLEEMFAYVDENGNLTTTPPDPSKKKVIKEEDILLGARKEEPVNPEDLIRTGKVTFYNSGKGFGFINDTKTQERVFVHVKELMSPIKENDIVTFEVERGPKGLNAVRVKVK